MMLAEAYEVIESDVIELDPYVTGFHGVLRELFYDGESYVYQETALSSGNRISSFSSRNEARARAFFGQAARHESLGELPVSPTA